MMIPSATFSSKRQGTILLSLLSLATLLLIRHTTFSSNNGSDVAFAPQYNLATSSQALSTITREDCGSSSGCAHLLEQAASPNINNNNVDAQVFLSYKHNLPLFEAVKSNNLQLVTSLLQGAGTYNVNAEDAQGLTPIIEATLIGNVEMVKLLLKHGALAQPAPGFRHTPLRAACLTANLGLIRLLVDMGADVNAQSEGGRTPLMGACYLRPQFDALSNRGDLSFDACQLMLQLGANPHVENSFGESALDLCVGRGYERSVKLLKSWWNEKRYARLGAAAAVGSRR